MSGIITSRQNAVYCAACGYLNILSFGYMIGFSSPALPQMTVVGGIIYGDEEAASWFGSFAMLGAILGCLSSAWLVDAYGRRTSLIGVCAPFFIGNLSIALSNSIWPLYIGRFLIGFASGTSSVAAPLYIAETVPKDLRGLLGAGLQFLVTIGILIVYSLGVFLSWRSLAFFGAIIPVVACMATMRAPESPRFLLNSHRKGECLTALVWLLGTRSDALDACAKMEKVQAESADQATLAELFTNSELFRPLSVALGVMTFQQTTGINAVMFYSVSIFQAAGYKDYDGLATVVIGIVQVIMTGVACTLMDNRGRRQMLIIAGFGMAISSFLLGTFYYVSSSATDQGLGIGWMALVSLIGYIVSFSLGWGPVPMLLTSEIFAARVRGMAASVAMLFNWTLGFIVTRYFASMNSMLGLDGSFWLFAVCSFLAVLFVFRFVPETKGKSLEEIEKYFSRSQLSPHII